MASAQSFNQWRGGEEQADWNDPYMWKNLHVPGGDESVYFRSESSRVRLDSVVELNNGILLYGRDLVLEGEGGLNLLNTIEYKRTVNIPAAASGASALTLGGSLTLNARLALAAKAFGLSESRGSITLRDHANVTGPLQIGNNGNGNGDVFIYDEAVFRITGLELNTLAGKGGSAGIHVLGGTAHLATQEDPFLILLDDPSRRIVLGENGLLRIDSDRPPSSKNELLSDLISKRRIVPADGCRFSEPVIDDDRIELTAVSLSQPPAVSGGEPEAQTADTAVAAVSRVSLESLLLKQVAGGVTNPSETGAAPSDALAAADTEPEADQSAPAPLAGYIVFVSALLFCLRPRAEKK